MSAVTPATGVVRVTTASGSVYEVDLTLGYLRRAPSDSEPLSADLRRDGEWIKILQVVRLSVGERAVFRLESLDVTGRALFTARATTPVISIEPS